MSHELYKVSFKKSFLVLSFLATFGAVKGQGIGLPVGSDEYRIAERAEIKYGLLPDYHPALKMWNRGSLVHFALHVDSLAVISPSDKRDLRQIFLNSNEWLGQWEYPQTVAGHKTGRFVKIKGDSLYRFIPSNQAVESTKHPYYFRNKKPIWNFFYPTPANWVEFNEPHWYLRLNPMVDFKVGSSDVFLNRRGVSLRAGFDNRIFVYSEITDTQLRWLPYLNEYVDHNKAVPGNGFYKKYNSGIFNSDKAFDILNGQAFAGINVTRHVGLQFGHGRNFIGYGYRSLFLSDFSHNYLFLKINWEFGKLYYQNLYTELEAVSAQANPGSVVIPKKYLAAHYFSYRFSPKFSLGFYEAVVFSREGQFELGYLNPVILYRTVEHLLDSKDNILIGLDFKYDFKNRIRFYGQYLLDEFKSTEIFSGNGWWANKWAWQLGAKYIDAFGIDHLDLQLETNRARPFTYTHDDLYGSSYSHYNQALAHPLGANFREWLLNVHYQPLERLQLQGRVIHYVQGRSPEGQNWGEDILLPNTSRTQDYGNEIGEPIKAEGLLLGLDASWKIYHNLFAEIQYFRRSNKIPGDDSGTVQSFLSTGIRWNIAQQRFDF